MRSRNSSASTAPKFWLINGLLGRPAAAPGGNETNLHPLAERGGNPSQHGQRVAFVVGIFEAADGRGAGAHELGELALREARAVRSS